MNKEELIKQSLNYFSNTEFILPRRHGLSVPRYERENSFSEVSDWSNKNKLQYPAKLPRIFSQTENLKEHTKTARSTSYGNNSQFCPVKQMDINLQPLKQIEQSYYCQYIKKKAKKAIKQTEYLTSFEKERTNNSFRRQSLGAGKLQEIIKRQKITRFNVNLDDYLRATQLFQHTKRENKKQA